jgi:hypothetical protein
LSQRAFHYATIQIGPVLSRDFASRVNGNKAAILKLESALQNAVIYFSDSGVTCKRFRKSRQ